MMQTQSGPRPAATGGAAKTDGRERSPILPVGTGEGERWKLESLAAQRA